MQPSSLIYTLTLHNIVLKSQGKRPAAARPANLHYQRTATAYFYEPTHTFLLPPSSPHDAHTTTPLVRPDTHGPAGFPSYVGTLPAGPNSLGVVSSSVGLSYPLDLVTPIPDAAPRLHRPEARSHREGTSSPARGSDRGGPSPTTLHPSPSAASDRPTQGGKPIIPTPNRCDKGEPIPVPRLPPLVAGLRRTLERRRVKGGGGLGGERFIAALRAVSGRVQPLATAKPHKEPT